MASRIAILASGKKATDIIILEMGETVGYTDFFVIATASNPRLTRAVGEEIQGQLRDARRRPARVEGDREGEWVLLDYLDVVVHIFTPTARDFYRLETLWGDVPREAGPVLED